MWIQSLMLVFAVGCVGADGVGTDGVSTGGVSEDSTQTAAASLGGGFLCSPFVGVLSCAGTIGVLPINVNVKSLSVLSGDQILVLNNDLNNVAILDGGVLNGNKILNDAETTVLSDFLNKFHITVTRNNIDVCAIIAAIGGVTFCQ